MAGAGREYRRVFTILLYQCSFVGLCVSLAMVVTLVGVEIALPEAVDSFARNPTAEGLATVLATVQASPAAAPPWIVASLLSALLCLATLIWLAGTWRAYRIVLGLSVRRSLAALAIFAVLLGVPVTLLIVAAIIVS
jgi:hypothetical protein